MDITGKRILIVEDDFRLADALCADLRRRGAVVVGPAPTPFYAMQLLGRRGVDGAVLDVRLHGTTVFGLADELCRRGTPILFATAQGDDVMPERFRERPRIAKPYDPEGLLHALQALQPDGHGTRASGPLGSKGPGAAGGNRRTRMLRAICGAMRASARARSGEAAAGKSPR